MNIVLPVSNSSVGYFLNEIKPLLNVFNFKYEILDSIKKLDSKQRSNFIMLLIFYELLFPEENSIMENL